MSWYGWRVGSDWGFVVTGFGHSLYVSRQSGKMAYLWIKP